LEPLRERGPESPSTDSKEVGEVGYVEGRNLSIEYRWANDAVERLTVLAAELVRRKVEVIVAFPGTAALAARHATRTTPVVFHTGGDPVKLGLVASFNRPGANLTGVSQLSGALAAKRLDVLHNLIPNAPVIAVLADPQGASIDDQLEALRQAAPALGVSLVILKVEERDIDKAFASLAEQRARWSTADSSRQLRLVNGGAKERAKASRIREPPPRGQTNSRDKRLLTKECVHLATRARNIGSGSLSCSHFHRSAIGWTLIASLLAPRGQLTANDRVNCDPCSGETTLATRCGQDYHCGFGRDD
jgi:ABC transporter substrate binding protein